MTSTGVELDPRRIAWRIVDAVRPLGVERGIDLAESLLYLLAKAVSDDGLDLRDMSRSDPRQVLNLLVTLAHEDDLVDAATFLDVDDSTVLRMLSIIGEALDRGDWADRRSGWVAVLDAVYAASVTRSSALSEAHGTPEAMADLLARAVEVGVSAFDPLCGLGSTLLSAARHGATSLAGIDINPSAVRRTRIRLRMHGLDDAEVAVGNIFEVLPAHRKRYSTVVMHPPWGLRSADDTVSMLESLDLRAELFRGRAREMAWLHLALELLAPGGRAAVLLPATSTEQQAAYDDLVQRGLVEAVVAVPPGSTSPLGVRSVIWVVRAEASNEGDVMVFDAARIDLQDGGQPAAADGVLYAAGDRIRDWRRTGFRDVGPSHVARKVSHVDASSLGLWPARHLDAAPSTQPRAPEPPVHLLSRLRVEGYKSIGRLQEVPLAPITLVFGANSAGKSSLMQALLLLKQSIGEDTLVTQGDSADVGSFGGIVHRHEDRAVRFGLTFGAPPGLALQKTADPAEVRHVDLEFTGSDSGAASVSQVSVGVGAALTTWLPDGDKELVLDGNQVGPLFEEIALGRLLFPFGKLPDVSNDRKIAQRRSQARSVHKRLIEKGPGRLAVRRRGLLPSSESTDDLASYFVGSGPDLLKSFADRTAQAINGVGAELEVLLRNLVYLGPLRSAPQRFYQRGARGHLPGDGHDVAMYLFDNATVVAQVNHWLAELEIPYTLDVVPVSAGPVGLLGDLVALTLTDRRSGVMVTPADVGFGISQVLPIVVELLSGRNTVVCVEQPETHLHPRLQARLADLFIEAADRTGRGNQLIVETHSEHLLLRLQRRIREGAVAAADVSVLYVDQVEGAPATVQRLRMDDDGDFIDEWPTGFFDDRLDDLLSGL